MDRTEGMARQQISYFVVPPIQQITFEVQMELYSLYILAFISIYCLVIFHLIILLNLWMHHDPHPAIFIYGVYIHLNYFDKQIYPMVNTYGINQ